MARARKTRATAAAPAAANGPEAPPGCRFRSAAGVRCAHRPLPHREFCRAHAPEEPAPEAGAAAAEEIDEEALVRAEVPTKRFGRGARGGRARTGRMGRTGQTGRTRRGDTATTRGGRNGAGANGHGHGAAAARPAAVPRSEAELRARIEEAVRATLRRLPLSRMFPGLSPGGVLAGLRENLSRLVPAERVDLATALNEILARQKELFTAQSLRGAWEVVAGLGSGARELVERRLRGDYVVDEYGLDEEFLDLCRPFLKFMYRRWWRIQTTGIENIPGRGRALLVANHSGTVPWDAVMLAWAVQEEHPAPRYVRTLYLDWLTRLPFMSTLVTRTGQVLACPENAERLLGQDQLVAVFPEGLKGIGKAYAQRYRVARFGRGGFARVALRTGAPIIPVSIVGAEEIYPMLYRVDTLAKLVGMPYFPITPTFPWLGLLGLVPLPTRWRIRVGEPIRTDTYGAKGADSFVAVEAVANRTRDAIQRQIDESLAARKSVFR